MTAQERLTVLREVECFCGCFPLHETQPVPLPHAPDCRLAALLADLEAEAQAEERGESDGVILDFMDNSEMGQRRGYYVWGDGSVANPSVEKGKSFRQAVLAAMRAEKGEQTT